VYAPEDLSYHIISLGCSKNLVDAEIANGMLSRGGFSRADSPGEADILIINTCGFIEDAKKESLGVIFDALEEREGAPGAPGSFGKKTVVAGCLSGRYHVELAEQVPEVDFYYGVIDEGFYGALCRAFGIRAPRVRGVKRALTESLPYRYIKIAEGCSNRCSYCAIPLIRGDHAPRDPGAVMADARGAVREGAKELILVAQDTASYRHGEVTLPRLIAALSEVRGVEWIRLLYCHPDHVDDGLIDEYSRNPLLLKYIDLPFQHASRPVLERMGRKGDTRTHLSLLKKLRDRVPGIRVRSTFMVGFPGESRADFDELVGFVEAARVDRAGCFMYSDEDGTRALKLDGRVPPAVKRGRYRALMALLKKISAEKMRDHIGSTLRVLVEERVDESTWIGRTEYDAPEVDGIFYLTGADIRVNSIIHSVVTDSMEYDLMGVPV